MSFGRLAVVFHLVALIGCAGNNSQQKPESNSESNSATPEPKEEAPLLQPHQDAKYAPGQVWKVSGESTNTRLVVLRVERSRDGQIIIHAAVEGVEINTAQGIQSRIGHLPFARSAVEGSVTELAGKAELPPFEEGYALWREAFEKGEGGVFTVSVAEAVKFIGKTVAQ